MKLLKEVKKVNKGGFWVFEMDEYPSEEVVQYVIQEIEKGREPYDIIGDKFLANKLRIEQVNVLFGEPRVVRALAKAGYDGTKSIWPW